MAEELRGQHVIVEGLLLDRGPHHFPLLVAQTITAADNHGNPLPPPTVQPRPIIAANSTRLPGARPDGGISGGASSNRN